MPPKKTAPKRKSARVSEVEEKKARDDVMSREGLEWQMVGDASRSPYIAPLLALHSSKLPGCTKVVGFDIDFTVIQPKSGRKFATGAKDWQWQYDCVPQRLQDLHNSGHRVVFFTNQAGIEKLKAPPEEIMTKIGYLMDHLNIPVLACVSTGQNHYRKPGTAMWEYFAEKCNGGVTPDLSQCTYVGDAAGRAKDWAPGKPKDFSCSDRMFAANLGIEFKTPEEFFLNEDPAPFDWRCPDPQDFLSSESSKEPTYHSNKKELVLMVGPPASGKSTLTKRYFIPHGYQHVNRDTLGTPKKCIDATKAALKAGKSVVVDNTNPSKVVRTDYISLAKKEGIPCRCLTLQTPLPLAHHLNLVRQNLTKSEVRRVPDVGYNVYKKNFEEPTKAEGFSEVIKVNFIPKFDSDADKSVFLQWH